MGVRGVMSHVRQHLQDVSSPADLQSQQKEQRVIIVDGNAFAYWIYFRNIRRWACDYVKVLNNTVQVLTKFHVAGVVLIFVFDGPTPLSKLGTKYDRLLQQAAVCIGRRNTADVVYPPLLMIQCIKNVLNGIYTDVASTWGHMYTCSLGEADSDIVALAVELAAYGILSNDSDMLVFKGRHDIGLMPLWTLRSDDGLSAAIISPLSYSKVLGVRREYLWAVAALVGHDETPRDIMCRMQARLRAWKKQGSTVRRVASKTHRNKHSGRDKKRKTRPSAAAVGDLSDIEMKQSAEGLSGGLCEGQCLGKGGAARTQQLYADELEILCKSRSRTILSEDLMTSQETLKIAADVVVEAYSTHCQHSSPDMTVCVVAAVLGVDAMDVYLASKTEACRKGMHCTPTTSQTRRWSVCCSNTARECRRLLAYMMSSESHYVVHGLCSNQDFKDAHGRAVDCVGGHISTLTTPICPDTIQHSLYGSRNHIDTEPLGPCGNSPRNDREIFYLQNVHLLPWDLQVICMQHVYIPRIAYCDNNSATTSNTVNELHPSCLLVRDFDTFKGVYAMLAPYRVRLYSLLLASDNCEESLILTIREVLFLMGTAHCTDVAVLTIPRAVHGIMEECRAAPISRDGAYSRHFYSLLIFMLNADDLTCHEQTLEQLEQAAGLNKLSLELVTTCSIMKHVMTCLETQGGCTVDTGVQKVSPVMISFIATVLYRSAHPLVGEHSNADQIELPPPRQCDHGFMAFQWSVIELCVLHAEYAMCVAALRSLGRNIAPADVAMSLVSHMDSTLFVHIFSALAPFQFQITFGPTSSEAWSEHIKKLLFDCFDSLASHHHGPLDIVEGIIDCTIQLIYILYVCKWFE